MPSRKSHPTETHQEPRRSSLRRLSSIASLHTLNPFNRRRSNNIENSPSTTTSNVSLSSIWANASDRQKDMNTSDISSESDKFDQVPPLPALSLRKSSYICLPDDPIGGMPRSRTFSNLPLPTRAKKSTSKLQQSKSHARLPSCTSSNLPPSRLPTPTFSTRKHSTTRLVNASSNTWTGSRKLMRSDTEPLFPQALQRETSVPRLTAFKENISLSPIKPLTPYDDDLFGSPSRNYSSRQGWSEDGDEGLPLYAERSSGLTYQKIAEPRGVTTRRLSQKFESSPAYRGLTERAPTPGKPVQRWNSQPVLTNATNFRSSYGSEIKQTRLMSARQAPTPPPAKSPSTELLLNTGRARALSNSSSHHLRIASSQTAGVVESRPQKAISRARADSTKAKPGAITSAQPLTYWTGRFSSLNDRYRNEELSATDLSSPSILKFETDKMHTTEAGYRRMRKAIQHLYSLCATPEAEQSFFVWQKAVAGALAIPELARSVPVPESRTCAFEMSLKSDESFTPPSEARKMNFMDRLLGRRQKMGMDRPSIAPAVGGL
ncbi:hypothetical protein CKM354_000194400 [Cercospora kikuchii]|uniref:Uncharacterized protein n=1 Tax=Cercospora kikuchii TaxID=84275 RepID=A0A9P3C917_9PEZI|nr:uncharacterized protein CKM354_000194400 [Cercospora kikuchii]GIZ38528.1 hypothetical protein CKM354_000194400 [Cercospora kikuchii]